MSDGRPFVVVWRDAVLATTALTLAAKVVAFGVARYMRADGTGARPGIDRLCATCGVGRTTAIRARAMLVERGWLRVVEHGGTREGSKRATEYAARLPHGYQSDTPDPLDGYQSDTPDGDAYGYQHDTVPDPDGYQSDTPTGTNGDRDGYQSGHPSREPELDNHELGRGTGTKATPRATAGDDHPRDLDDYRPPDRTSATPPRPRAPECSTCDGNGWVLVDGTDPDGRRIDEARPCPACSLGVDIANRNPTPIAAPSSLAGRPDAPTAPPPELLPPRPTLAALDELPEDDPPF